MRLPQTIIARQKRRAQNRCIFRLPIRSATRVPIPYVGALHHSFDPGRVRFAAAVVAGAHATAASGRAGSHLRRRRHQPDVRLPNHRRAAERNRVSCRRFLCLCITLGLLNARPRRRRPNSAKQLAEQAAPEPAKPPERSRSARRPPHRSKCLPASRARPSHRRPRPRRHHACNPAGARDPRPQSAGAREGKTPESARSSPSETPSPTPPSPPASPPATPTPTPEPPKSESVTRREWISTLPPAAALTLAGCG